MRTADPALVAYFASLRGRGDIALIFADLYTFTLTGGIVLAYTSCDSDVVIGATPYVSRSVQVDGLKFKCGVDLSTDQKQITVTADDGDTIDGATSVLQAIEAGAFDGCQIRRDRVFFSDRPGGTVIGMLNLFQGRLATVDQVGRIQAKLTVNSDLVLLDQQMPRNLFQATCLHTLYDGGCTLSKAAFSASGTVGAGATATVIPWTGSILAYRQGSILFTSGESDGVTATVLNAVPGVSLTIGYPLDDPPAPGDTFTVSWGCDHTPATCKAKFNNIANFRAFPYVPPPETAI